MGVRPALACLPQLSPWLPQRLVLTGTRDEGPGLAASSEFQFSPISCRRKFHSPASSYARCPHQTSDVRLTLTLSPPIPASFHIRALTTQHLSLGLQNCCLHTPTLPLPLSLRGQGLTLPGPPLPGCLLDLGGGPHWAVQGTGCLSWICISH